MSDLQRVQRRVKYHHWAADRTMNGIATLSAKQLDEPMGGSFGNGRALLRHVIGVERLWCDRWSGKSPKGLPEYPATHGGADFRDEWNTIKADQKRFVDALTDKRLGTDLTYTNIKGETSTQPLAEIFEHVVNHGSYHRGQLTHLLRDRGIAATPTDYLVFMKEFPL